MFEIHRQVGGRAWPPGFPFLSPGLDPSAWNELLAVIAHV
jgi:hypothetical protein